MLVATASAGISALRRGYSAFNIQKIRQTNNSPLATAPTVPITMPSNTVTGRMFKSAEALSSLRAEALFCVGFIIDCCNNLNYARLWLP